jgi:hypothetical protein
MDKTGDVCISSRRASTALELEQLGVQQVERMDRPPQKIHAWYVGHIPSPDIAQRVMQAGFEVATLSPLELA